MPVLGITNSTPPPTIPITISQTWTPPLNGTAIIHCIGAGGGGTGWNATRGAGGGGGYSRKSVTLSTGTNWTFVVGAGGDGNANGDASDGGNGIVRIMWPGDERQFPTTRTGYEQD